MPTLGQKFWVLLFGLSVIVSAAGAQQQSRDQSAGNPAPPIQPVRLPLPTGPDNTDQNAQPLDPDTRPPTGAQDLSLGVSSTNRSSWQPFALVSGAFNSNSILANNTSGWSNWTTFLGGINIQRISENNVLALNYSGGGSISNGGGIGNTVFQTGSLSEQVQWGRSTISFLDSVGYLPQASFGYAGASGVPLPTGGAIGLQPGFIPNDAILTLQTQRITNSFITQVNRQLTRRTSLTFLGGYNVLHYFGTDLLNSNGVFFQGGYNYLLSRENTLSVYYGFNAFRYSNYAQSINSNSVGVAYSRRITGQLALRLSAGPSFSSFQTPISETITLGGVTGTVSGVSSASQVYFSANAGLNYQWGRTMLGLNYNHGISGGSGVLAGAISDIVFGSASRQLTRAVTAGITLGYSRNSGRNIASPTTATYNYSYGGVNLSRHLGRASSISLNYQFQYQNSSAPPCVGASCGAGCVSGLVCTSTYKGHAIWLSLSWMKQPFVF
jgi:hypothetical protein